MKMVRPREVIWSDLTCPRSQTVRGRGDIQTQAFCILVHHSFPLRHTLFQYSVRKFDSSLRCSKKDWYFGTFKKIQLHEIQLPSERSLPNIYPPCQVVLLFGLILRNRVLPDNSDLSWDYFVIKADRSRCGKEYLLLPSDGVTRA